MKEMNNHKVLIDAWGLIFLYFLLHFLHFCLFYLFDSSSFFPFLKTFSVFIMFCLIFLRVLVLCGFCCCAGFSSTWFLHFLAFLKKKFAWVVGILTTTTSWVWAEFSFGWRNTWTVPQCVSIYKYLYFMMLNNPSQRIRGDKQAKN